MPDACLTPGSNSSAGCLGLSSVHTKRGFDPGLGPSPLLQPSGPPALSSFHATSRTWPGGALQSCAAWTPAGRGPPTSRSVLSFCTSFSLKSASCVKPAEKVLEKLPNMVPRPGPARHPGHRPPAARGGARGARARARAPAGPAAGAAGGGGGEGGGGPGAPADPGAPRREGRGAEPSRSPPGAGRGGD